MERARGQDSSLADSVRRFERTRGDRVLSAERMQADGRAGTGEERLMPFPRAPR